MPIYEYICRNCGYEIEKLQKISDPAPQDCPGCDNPDMVKKVSAAAFRLKGGGWYETDFKSDNKKNLAGEGTKSKDKSDSAASSDSAGKSAAKGSSASTESTKSSKNSASDA